MFLSYKIKYKEELTIFGQWFCATLFTIEETKRNV